MLGWLHTALVDAATWKDLLWLFDPAAGARARGLHHRDLRVGHGLGLVTLPAWYSATGDPGVDLGALNVDTLDEAWIGIPVGLVVLTLAVPLTRGAGTGLALLGRALLGPSERRRVVELERTRAGAVDSQAAELQRIERDLHDGAQARLVALAMDLGMAQEKLDSDPVAARRLVAGAHGEAKRALSELRDLSRGIYPAILTDRGLGPALSSIAARQPGRGGARRQARRPPARRHRGGRLLRRGRGAHQRRQALRGRALPRAHRPPPRPAASSRSATTGTAAPIPPAPG